MNLEKFLEKAMLDAGADPIDIFDGSRARFAEFAELNNLDESKMFEFSDTGGIPIYCFDGTSDELTGMEEPENCSILVEELDNGEVRHTMVMDITIFGWPVEITLGYIELKGDLEEAGMI